MNLLSWLTRHVALPVCCPVSEAVILKTLSLIHNKQVGGLQATRDNGKTWITIQPVEGAFWSSIDFGGLYGKSMKVLRLHYLRRTSMTNKVGKEIFQRDGELNVPMGFMCMKLASWTPDGGTRRME
ncbi:hypothetical protein JHK85_051325 [Glycine max]|nr:hypothetical protein JHK85_051325 [Glycine max]